MERDSVEGSGDDQRDNNGISRQNLGEQLPELVLSVSTVNSHDHRLVTPCPAAEADAIELHRG